MRQHVSTTEINPHTARLIAAAQSVQLLLDNGDMFSGDEAGTDRAVKALDELQAASTLADQYQSAALLSPFERYRNEILGCHSTAYRLQALVLHLWNNDDWPVKLANLMASADERYERIAIELIASYGHNGENDPHFMALGRLLAEERMAELAETTEQVFGRLGEQG
ncbi:hypothetical protein [Denitromonas iodatirespirans]|uniref:Uncharacterized protein n=1 Tax=Denitromonas iodatirespirans TaxID=2795389 RepID=A0A944D7V5_DENI1|nr:hypothetical protein [Denitromonas iodatirespirans]MBT0961695.1 hypothetical protein [Denitromonas iodatirespirans]